MEGSNTNTKTIVVAVDESEESMYALSWCLSNLVPLNSQNTLVLLYVKPPPPLHSPLDAAGYMFSGDVVGAVEKYGSGLVKSVMGRADDVYRNLVTNNIRVEKRVGTGEAKYVICGMVKKMRADVLVMGCHGYGFIKRALLGSVSEYCAKNAKCPVVVVKRPNHINC
uniref:UspA domain-containing protein n=1 Tax=Kalanchoe fedtschenkoi TaxID=63787 RepID=A0A7N0TM82_KALFE